MCDFCGKSYDGLRLRDRINNGVNKFELSLVGSQLRIWNNGAYCGCYDIEFCPVCGRKLKSSKFVDENSKQNIHLDSDQFIELQCKIGYVLGIIAGATTGSDEVPKQALEKASDSLLSVLQLLQVQLKSDDTIC